MPHWKLHAVAASVCALAAGQVQAETYTLTLDAVAGDIIVDSFLSGGKQFHVGRLSLDGLFDAIDLVQGDELSASVTIVDGPLMVPASPEQVFGFEVRGPVDPLFDDAPNADPVFSANVTFYLMGEVVHAGGGGCGNCSFAAIFKAPGEAFSFDQIEVTGQFLNLTSTYTIDNASFSYQLSQPVPEPATWALWLAGLGLAGAAARRRAHPAAA